MIFQRLRRFLDALEDLTSALQGLATVQRDLGPAIDRLEALERARIHFEADCEGMLLKADGKLKAAASAEARERQLKKANERLADPFPENGDDETPEAAVLPDNAAPSKADRLLGMRMAMASTNPKAAALNHKFGLS